MSGDNIIHLCPRYAEVVLLTRKSRLLCLLSLLTVVAPLQAQEAKQTGDEDATTQSVRDQGRILLKRNFLASEFQSAEQLGFAQLSFQDAEGVDARANFRLRAPAKKINLRRLSLSAVHQDASGETKPSGALTINQNLGDVFIQGQIARNASARSINQYESRWRLLGDGTSYLSYPSYTRDDMSAESWAGNLRADYTIRPRLSLTYEMTATRYQDTSFRTKLENQIASGAQIPESYDLGFDGRTVTGLDVESGSLRHYQHERATKRDIDRHQLTLKSVFDDNIVEVRAYSSTWQNSLDWLPWNFLTRGVDIGYEVANPWLPTVDLGPQNAVADPALSRLRDYRQMLTVIKDRDSALAIDWDRSLEWGNADISMSIGLNWRTKERNADDQRLVYQPTPEATFGLVDAVGSNSVTRMMPNNFSLPPTMNHSFARNLLLGDRRGEVVLNELLSLRETVEQGYQTEETISAGYFFAEIEHAPHALSMGARREFTETNTLGTLIASVGDVPMGSTRVEGATIFGQTIIDTFDGTDFYKVPGSNSYSHWVPSIQYRYEPAGRFSYQLAWFEQLMRPQYFDIVNYRRVWEGFRRIDQGNPDLRAATIRTASAALEYQHGDLSAAFEIYDKSIADFAYKFTATEVIDGEVYLSGSIYNGKEATVSGWQARLNFDLSKSLSVFDSAKLGVRYTYSDSSAEITDRTVPVPERAAHFGTANLSLGWRGWTANSRFTMQSETLDSIGQVVEQDQYRERIIRWDQTLSYTTTNKVRFDLSVANVLDRPERNYEQNRLRVLKNEYSGSLIKLTVSKAL